MSTGLYLEVRDAVGAMFEADPADVLDRFGLADLLESSDQDERNAVFALAEAQGRAGATSDVVSRIALAGSGLATTAAYAMTLDERPGEPDLAMGVLGSNGQGQCILNDPLGQAFEVGAGALAAVASPLDPAYLRVFTLTAGLGAATEFPSSEFAEARARIACAAELLGTCEAMLSAAVQYAGVRQQFGKPLAAFQAVAHSLAWAATEVHQLRALIQVCLQSDAVKAPDPSLAAVTKSMAGTVGRRVAQITLQVTGGMGFTWEYSHNAQHRRVLALDAVCGSANALNLELGERLRTQAGGEANGGLISLAALSERAT